MKRIQTPINDVTEDFVVDESHKSSDTEIVIKDAFSKKDRKYSIFTKEKAQSSVHLRSERKKRQALAMTQEEKLYI